jgi:hypothetical protein
MKGPDNIIGTAHHDNGLARDLNAAEIARLLELALVTGELPDFGKYLFLFLGKNARVRENSIVEIMRLRKTGLRVPIDWLDHMCAPNQRYAPFWRGSPPPGIIEHALRMSIEK